MKSQCILLILAAGRLGVGARSPLSRLADKLMGVLAWTWEPVNFSNSSTANSSIPLQRGGRRGGHYTPSAQPIWGRESPIPALPNGGKGRFVAVGDSFAAGLGTDKGLEAVNSCRQGDGSYPNLLARDMRQASSFSSWRQQNSTTWRNDTAAAAGAGRRPRMRRPGARRSHDPELESTRGFEEQVVFLACSAATTEDVLAFQSPSRGYPARGKESRLGPMLWWMTKTPSGRDGFNMPADYAGPFISPDWWRRQLDMFPPSADDEKPSARISFATLSLGGNDFGFTPILNACIFRFAGKMSGQCEDRMASAVIRIQSAAFGLRMFDILDDMFRRADAWGANGHFCVFWTGYARFFNDETDACDDTSFEFWRRRPGADDDSRPRRTRARASANKNNNNNNNNNNNMTRLRRRQLNALVSQINARCAAIADAYNRARFPAQTGKRVLFVDYDAKFDGHRFCEPDRPPDADVWFFVPFGSDNAVRDDGSVAVAPPPPPASAAGPHACLFDALRTRDGRAFLACLARALDGWRPEEAAGAANRGGVEEEEEAVVQEAFKAVLEDELVAAGHNLTKRLEPRGWSLPNTIAYVPTVLGKVMHPVSAFSSRFFFLFFFFSLRSCFPSFLS